MQRTAAARHLYPRPQKASAPDWCVPASAESDYWILVPWHQEARVGRRGYPPEFRRKVLDLVEAGRSVADVARDLGISEQTVYSWRRQDRIDRGLVPGLTSAEKAELAAAKRRVAELETQLTLHRPANQALGRLVSPKGGFTRSPRL